MTEPEFFAGGAFISATAIVRLVSVYVLTQEIFSSPACYLLESYLRIWIFCIDSRVDHAARLHRPVHQQSSSRTRERAPIRSSIHSTQRANHAEHYHPEWKSHPPPLPSARSETRLDRLPVAGIVTQPSYLPGDAGLGR